MIHSAPLLIVYLLAIETIVLVISCHHNFKKYFKFIPAVFWIYFLPMLSASCGIIDSKNEIYQHISYHLLPAALALLLLSSNIKAIVKLEKQALIMMLSGSFGIMLATPIVFSLVKQWVGPAMWSGFGALSASWIGGSANMIAVKEALGAPDTVFAPMVIVDTVVPYCWMGLLVAAVTLQTTYDRWNKSSRLIIHQSSSPAHTNRSAQNFKNNTRYSPFKVCLIFLFAGGGAALSIFMAAKLPSIKNVISNYTGTIIIVSIIGVIASLTPLKKLEHYGSEKIGYFLLYFVLTSIGARSNISQLHTTLILIVAGFLIVAIHAIILLIVSRIIKAPMFLVAVASQANIGGVASAPIVAAVYQPSLASVGLLLAILGNIIGTYLGIITGQLCRLLT